MIAAIRLVHLAAAVRCSYGECTVTRRWIARAATDRNGWKIYNVRLMTFLLGCFAAGHFAALPASAWDHWGRDRGGTRFSPLQQITPANVDRLVRGWEFHTGDLARRDSRLMARTKFEATPLFVESSLILCTPFNEVIALDPLLFDGIEAGAANVWAPMSVDEARGLVLLPTSSPSPDFWGGKRPGNNQHADSVVALRAETGELVWAFQTVHHDVWDYDLPAQPGHSVVRPLP